MKNANPRRRSVWQWIKIVGIGLAITAVTAVIVIAGYNQAVILHMSSRFPVPGQLLDVNDRKMHIYCSGTGSPTILLESGLGGSWLDWALVQPELSKITRVCSYDRAGMGWSDSGPKPRSSSQIAADLEALLNAAGVSSPYVLVGHSLGGMHVRVYAMKHPDQVAGLVLVDATNPKESEMLPAEVKQRMESEIKLIGVTKLLMASGIARLMGVCDQVPAGAESIAPYSRIEACRAGRMSTIREEYNALALDEVQAANSGPFKNTPLLVLSHDPKHSDGDMPLELQAKVEGISEQMQNELAQLSNFSKHVVVPNAGHYIQLDRPDAVITQIGNLVRALRQNTR